MPPSPFSRTLFTQLSYSSCSVGQCFLHFSSMKGFSSRISAIAWTREYNAIRAKRRLRVGSSGNTTPREDTNGGGETQGKDSRWVATEQDRPQPFIFQPARAGEHAPITFPHLLAMFSLFVAGVWVSHPQRRPGALSEYLRLAYSTSATATTQVAYAPVPDCQTS